MNWKSAREILKERLKERLRKRLRERIKEEQSRKIIPFRKRNERRPEK